MNMSDYRYFKYSEFDSPDLEGSGKKMNDNFLEMLSEAREISNTPFKITSGYRTKDYNIALQNKGFKASKNSAHLKGLAADISCTTSAKRWLIIDSLLIAGFTRIGIGKNFIHCDIDTTKTQNLIWVYFVVSVFIIYIHYLLI